MRRGCVSDVVPRLRLAILCVSSVAATDAVFSGNVGDGGGQEEEEAAAEEDGTIHQFRLLTATQAAWMASLVGVGFLALAVSFLAFAASPRMQPASMEAVKAVVIAVVVGCVAVADTLPGMSDRGQEQPELFVAAVCTLCCLPPLLEASPAATVAAAPVVVMAHLAATLTSDSGRASFGWRGAPRVMLMSVAAWLASLLAAGGVVQTFSLKEKPFDPYV